MRRIAAKDLQERPAFHEPGRDRRYFAARARLGVPAWMQTPLMQMPSMQTQKATPLPGKTDLLPSIHWP